MATRNACKAFVDEMSFTRAWLHFLHTHDCFLPLTANKQLRNPLLAPQFGQWYGICEPNAKLKGEPRSGESSEQRERL
jgi:hypothetical protein